MITLTPAQLKTIEDHARAAYPKECCGLLTGERGGRRKEDPLTVRQVVESDNMADGDRLHDRFEVDPKVIFNLMREIEHAPESIVGHYHSHPDHPAEPSQTDRAQAYDPSLFWLITSVDADGACETRAFHIDGPHGTVTPLAITLKENG